jgi:predicted metal-binding protein
VLPWDELDHDGEGMAVDAQDYVRLALELGATDAVRFGIDDIVFEPRTILKCMFGCGDWGLGPTCPSRPGSLMPWEYEPLLRRYSWGVMVHTNDKKTGQDVSFELERRAFLDGHYLAFSLSDCARCAECVGLKGKPCADPKKARPAFHSVGIDVFATARRFGLPIETLADEDDPQNWYSAVFVE